MTHAITREFRGRKTRFELLPITLRTLEDACGASLPFVADALRAMVASYAPGSAGAATPGVLAYRSHFTREVIRHALMGAGSIGVHTSVVRDYHDWMPSPEDVFLAAEIAAATLYGPEAVGE